MENIVFVSSHLDGLDYHAQEERRSQLRLALLNMGLDFYPVKINDQKFFMVTTKNLSAMKNLAKKFDQGKIYISDNRRTTFVVSLADNSPTKLGTLKRSSLSQPGSGVSTTGTGSFCLIVTQDNKDYYYIVE